MSESQLLFSGYQSFFFLFYLMILSQSPLSHFIHISFISKCKNPFSLKRSLIHEDVVFVQNSCKTYTLLKSEEYGVLRLCQTIVDTKEQFIFVMKTLCTLKDGINRNMVLLSKQ